MKRTAIILSLLLVSGSVSVLAQVPPSSQSGKASLDIYWEDEHGNKMSLTKNLDSIPLLITFDEKIVRAGEYIDIDLNQEEYSANELATFTGVKANNVKAYRMLRGTDATKLWGVRGCNGVLEVISPSKYLKLKKRGQLENFRLAGDSPSKLGKPMTFLDISTEDVQKMTDQDIDNLDEAQFRMGVKPNTNGFYTMYTLSAKEVNVSDKLYNLVKKIIRNSNDAMSPGTGIIYVDKELEGRIAN